MQGSLRAASEPLPRRGCGLSRAASSWTGKLGTQGRDNTARQRSAESLTQDSGLFDPCLLEQPTGSFDPAGTVLQTAQPSRHIPQTADGKPPRPVPRGQRTAMPQQFPSSVAAGRGPTERCDRSWSHLPTVLDPLLARGRLSHPQPTYPGRSPLQRSLPRSAAHRLPARALVLGRG